jgi:hypothetical protein
MILFEWKGTKDLCGKFTNFIKAPLAFADPLRQSKAWGIWRQKIE